MAGARHGLSDVSILSEYRAADWRCERWGGEEGRGGEGGRGGRGNEGQVAEVPSP